MNTLRRLRRAALSAAVLAAACGGRGAPPSTSQDSMEARLSQYATVRLTADVSRLSDVDRQVVRILMEAARPMQDVFWREAWGPEDSLMALIPDTATRRYAEINVGPWDRLHGNEPFVEGVGPKPAGANFYPRDMTREEFEAAATANPALRGEYTLVRRNEDGDLVASMYHEAFAAQHQEAADRLKEAAQAATDPGLKRYLSLRAEALLTDQYRESDMAWMDMKDNVVDVVIGPIETYEDRLFGYKASHEAFVLIKDLDWSRRLQRYARFLPELQRGLPVPDALKREQPGSAADLAAYDVVYVAGDADAGSKTIAINLPNDEEVQLTKGTRRLQLENAMRAKFDKILAPIADVLIAPDQRRHVTFDAFFGNTMFHEVAHGLGVKNTINGRGTAREALKEHYSAMEEGKADVLGLYMVTQLRKKGEIPDGTLEDNYVTFLASIFRSVRFGASSAHGKANMARFNYFAERGAFARDPDTGTYRVDFDRMGQAVDSLSALILTMQGEGDYEGAGRFLAEKGVVPPQLQEDLDRLTQRGIPVDIVYEQGPSVLFGEQP